MGILITLKEDEFKQNNKTSENLETLGPLWLKTLKTTPVIKI